MRCFTDRKIFLINSILCVISFLIVLYLQFDQKINPCSLCVFQRVGVIGVLLFSVIGLIFAFRLFWLRLMNYLLILISGGFGFAAAFRQVWIQHLPPDQVPACGAGLAFLMKTFSITDVVAKVFEGSGSCAIIHMYFLGLNIAEWSLLLFVILLILTVRGLFWGCSHTCRPSEKNTRRPPA